MFFRRLPFLRDGLLSIAVGVGWSASMAALSRFSGNIIYTFFWWMLDTIRKPALAAINGLINSALNVTGLNSPQAQVNGTDQIVALSLGIPFFLIYWFLLGGVVCLLYRLVRERIRAAFASAGPKVGTQS